MENKSLFLKEVSLSGFKSINNVNVQFQRGLNIIIGKNAAGKTNFLNFLSNTLSLNYSKLNNFSSELVFSNGKEVSIKTTRNIEIEDIFKNSLSPKIETELKISNKIQKIKDGSSVLDELNDNDILFDNTLLYHGIPKEYLIVDLPYKFKVKINGGLISSNELMNIIRDSDIPYFIRCFLLNLLFSIINKENFQANKIKKDFKEIFAKTESIREVLKMYSPIEDIKFSDNYNIFLSKDKKDLTINNLFLEFKIDGNWLPYSSLSDGTRRLFYIISEVIEIESYTGYKPSTWGFSNRPEISRIVLIEEPELGIHPHQFHKLMEFLKIESQKKQIIITTHSPQALDSLEKDELNRIIIAYSTNSKEGTKLRHLNEDELEKAQQYIKDDFLSDYWLYSDLEK